MDCYIVAKYVHRTAGINQVRVVKDWNLLLAMKVALASERLCHM